METPEPVVIDVPVNEGLDLDVPEEGQEVDPLIVMLIKERLSRGWSQWDVARRMGYTAPAMISNLEAGKVDPRISTLRAWAATMDVTILGRVPVRRGRPRTNFR